MNTEPKYSPSAQAVINDYLDRLNGRLTGFPPADREDLLREIQCHIDEAFAGETGEDEMEKLLRVLRRLGEPADVISERISPAMVKLGRKKGLPFYILSGVLIVLFGLPLGAGLFGVLIGVLAAAFALVVAYYVAALSLIASGAIGAIVSVIVMWNPDIVERINQAFGTSIQLASFGGALYLSPQTEALVCLTLCIILAGLGLLMLWGGRYLLRGIKYLFRISWEKIRQIFSRSRHTPAAGHSAWMASTCL